MRTMATNEPHKYKFSRVVEPTVPDIGEDEEAYEKRRAKWVDKQDCYSICLSHKESPGILSNIGVNMEEALKANGLGYQKI